MLNSKCRTRSFFRVIHAIIDTTPKKKYILAVEQTPCNLKHIVKALNKFMGNGKINLIEPMEAYLLTNVTVIWRKMLFNIFINSFK